MGSIKSIALALLLLGLLAMKVDAAEIPACLKRLAAAKSVQTSRIGEGGQKSEYYTDFLEASKLNIKAMGPELDWLVANGTPAGRVYAGFVAWEVQIPTGKERFESLTKDTAKVKYQSGCEIMETTVGDIAKEFVAQSRYQDFASSVFCKLPMAVKPAAPINDKAHDPPACLITLKNAKLLGLGHKGDTKQNHPEFAAYVEAAKQLGTIEKDLKQQLPSATAAGSIYMVCLLYAINPKEGLAKLQSMKSSKEKVDCRSGCFGWSDTVGNIAEQLSTSGNFHGLTIGHK